MARAIKFVPETTPLDRMLRACAPSALHLAAVLDEYGGVAGVVTLENVIEEIVGAIQDEFDTEKPELVAKGDGVYQVSGAMLVVDLEDELDLELSERDEDTIGGVVLSELGRRPRVGDRGRHRAAQLEVLEMRRQPHPHPAAHCRDAPGAGAGELSRLESAQRSSQPEQLGAGACGVARTATACLSRSRRSESSTCPAAKDLPPTTTRTGMPMRSASLNLTPGRSSRSSRAPRRRAPRARRRAPRRAAADAGVVRRRASSDAATSNGASGSGQMMPLSSWFCSIGRRDGAADAEAVAAHDHRVLCRRSRRGRSHFIASRVLGAELEDVADLDAARDSQRRAAARAGVARARPGARSVHSARPGSRGPRSTSTRWASASLAPETKLASSRTDEIGEQAHAVVEPDRPGEADRRAGGLAHALLGAPGAGASASSSAFCELDLVDLVVAADRAPRRAPLVGLEEQRLDEALRAPRRGTPRPRRWCVLPGVCARFVERLRGVRRPATGQRPRSAFSRLAP